VGFGALDGVQWQFEVQLHDDGWVVYDKELAGGPGGRAGVHEHPDLWDDPVQYARDQLDEALAELVDVGEGLGMRRARIAMWPYGGSRQDPLAVLQATDEQLALGRLRNAANDVQWAVRELEKARARLRSQVIAADAVDRLGRNKIARELEDGGWSRRLILQFLAGRDLVRSVQRALPRQWSTECPWEYDPRDAWEVRLGPFWCGPVEFDLDATGRVSLCLIDRDGPPQPDPDADDDERKRYEQDAAARACTAARTIVPLLQRAGFELVAADGRSAGVDELAGGRSVTVRKAAAGTC
jgi:hypothetical protein